MLAFWRNEMLILTMKRTRAFNSTETPTVPAATSTTATTASFARHPSVSSSAERAVHASAKLSNKNAVDIARLRLGNAPLIRLSGLRAEVKNLLKSSKLVRGKDHNPNKSRTTTRGLSSNLLDVNIESRVAELIRRRAVNVDTPIPTRYSVDDCCIRTPIQIIEDNLNFIIPRSLVNPPDSSVKRKKTPGRAKRNASSTEASAAENESKEANSDPSVETFTTPSSLPSFLSLWETLSDLKLLHQDDYLSLLPASRTLNNSENNMITPYSYYHTIDRKWNEYVASSNISANLNSSQASRYPDTFSDSSSSRAVTLEEDELMIHISIYAPQHSSDKGCLKWKGFIVPSTVTLSELNDAINCHSDEYVPESHALFMIEDKVYGDDRHSLVFAERIVQWLVDRKRNGSSREGESASRASNSTNNEATDSLPALFAMQNTALSALSIRLDAHYLYHHAGDCAHTIVFTKITPYLPTAHVRIRSLYPILVYQSKTKVTICSMCLLYPAIKLTYNDLQSHLNPCAWCQQCYDAMHTNVDNAHSIGFTVKPCDEY